jgi:hypothetical protein
VRRERFPMVPPDPFSDSLRGTIRDPLLAPVLGTVEGSYAELVGQDLPGIPPIIKSCVKRAVEAQSGSLSA